MKKAFKRVIWMAQNELIKWRRLVWIVTICCIVIISIPWIPGKFKFFMAVPLYGVLVCVYYKYLCLKKGSK